jgi:hypothetical protein
VCQGGTRARILEHIREWADADNSPAIFWLYGPAGTGKSTIARTIAYELAGDKQLGARLGASYFFDDRVGRNDWRPVFPTIADRLMATIPEFPSYLREYLQSLGDAKKEALEMNTKDPEVQFERLIQNPLNKMPFSTPKILTRIIVIDALDECKSDQKIGLICSQLLKLQEIRTIRLRVFLTSRDHPHIGNAFKTIAHRPFSLLTNPDDTKDDIKKFLEQKFEDIKSRIKEISWPDPEHMSRVVSLATEPKPLFIYASILCRYVGDVNGEPVDRLKDWLEMSSDNASQLDESPDEKPDKKLDEMYETVLGKVFDTAKGENSGLNSKEKKRLKDMLHSIVLLVTPLPAEHLIDLLGMTPGNIRLLKNLRPVLSIPSDDEPVDDMPKPVEIIHKSFSDFLLRQQGTGSDSFRVDAAETHAMLASKCINRMKTTNGGLRKDMCNLQDYGKPRDKIDETTIRKVIPPDLKYATLNWVYHLQHYRRDITNENKIEHHISDEDIYDFFRKHFLHWLEALSLIGAMSESDALISTLQSLIVVSHLIKCTYPRIYTNLTYLVE